MPAIFNKLDFSWDFTDDVNSLANPSDWLIDPQFLDFDRCQLLGPRLWVFYQSGSPAVDMIRSYTDVELDTEPQFLVVAMTEKIQQLSLDCRAEIIGGFVCDALGSPYTYDTEEVDQLNLVGSVAATDPDGQQYYAVRDVNTGVKQYLLHTHANLRQVLQDGATWKLGLLQKFYMKRAYVESLTSVADINAVTWASSP